MSGHSFGGAWTKTKLSILTEYLNAYTPIIRKYFTDVIYIDAFAGTGEVYRTDLQPETEEPMFPELTSDSVQEFMEGSVLRALKANPPFNQFYFIEKDENKIPQLEELVQNEKPEGSKHQIIHGEANKVLKDICLERGTWKHARAVIFLDPYGMQVEWDTLVQIAQTCAVDLWILFPLGMGVNRLLPRDGNISDGNRRRLNLMFGTEEWYDVFYSDRSEQLDIFDPEARSITKLATFEVITDYWNKRLDTIFPNRVLDERCMLKNSSGNPIYLLSFAASNPKGAPIALKIARHIVKKWNKDAS